MKNGCYLVISFTALWYISIETWWCLLFRIVVYVAYKTLLHMFISVHKMSKYTTNDKYHVLWILVNAITLVVKTWHSFYISSPSLQYQDPACFLVVQSMRPWTFMEVMSSVWFWSKTSRNCQYFAPGWNFFREHWDE